MMNKGLIVLMLVLCVSLMFGCTESQQMSMNDNKDNLCKELIGSNDAHFSSEGSMAIARDFCISGSIAYPVEVIGNKIFLIKKGVEE